jgi:putative transposase
MAHDRCQVGGAADVFLQLWQAGVEQVDELQGLEWDGRSRDGAMPKAPRGGKTTGPHPRDRATGGVKRRLVTEGHGVPIGLAAAGANRHDVQLVRATLDSLIAERPTPLEAHPPGRCLDPGDDDQEGREILAEFGFTAPMRSRGEAA